LLEGYVFGYRTMLINYPLIKACMFIGGARFRV
jgi:hypothetical protein